MKKSLSLLVFLPLIGCSKAPEAPVRDEKAVLHDTIIRSHSEDLSLAKLLAKSRRDLAHEATDLETVLLRQDQLRQEGQIQLQLLPERRFPFLTPIFREAKYQETVGLSLPPYMEPGRKDSVVAVHLARFGDHEAALQLVEPGDDASLAVINSYRLERNIPLEWTRVVSLLQHQLQFRIACNHPESAKQLLALHCQLRQILPERARNGVLGQTLLPQGLAVLRQAARSWSGPAQHEIDEFFKTIESGLPTPFTMPKNAENLQRVLGGEKTATTVSAASVLRGFDLLCLEVPHQHADACVAFLGENQTPVEILVTYRPFLFDYVKAEQFAQGLEERLTGTSGAGDLPQRTYASSGVEIDVTLTPRHKLLGGVVRYRSGAALRPSLVRDFGSVRLDGSFEQNRRRFAWKQQGTSVSVVGDKNLVQPLTGRPVSKAVLHADPRGLVEKLEIDYGSNDAIGLGETARGLFAILGRPEWRWLTAGAQPRLDLVWRDDSTQYTLDAPFLTPTLQLDVRDVSDPATRVARVKAFDDAQRRERIARGEPLSLIGRKLDRFTLGMSQEAFVAALPVSGQLVQRTIPEGVMAAWIGNSSVGADHLAREWFGRFQANRLVELRVRYADASGAKPGSAVKARLETYKSQLGQPATAKTIHRWHDDLTLLTCRHDSAGVEVVLRDCPADQADGVPLPPLRYLPTGNDLLKLGDSQSELAKLNPTPKEDHFVVLPKTKDKFDAYLVWVEAGKVVKITARHKLAKSVRDEDRLGALGLAWSQNPQLGFPRYLDGDAKRRAVSWSSSDDQTRYRLYLQEDERGTFLFSEWSEVR